MSPFDPSRSRGIFISLEGVEGSGKTTQFELLVRALRDRGLDVVDTYEPGGTPLGSEIRDILLDTRFSEMDATAEAVLYAADRAQHVAEVIKPALRQGKMVVCDRYVDSSLAYQGTARGVGLEAVKNLNEWAMQDLYPDVTFLLDMPAEEGLARLEGQPDRLEAEPGPFHQKVRDSFLTLAKLYPGRFVVVDATQTRREVHAKIMAELERLL